MVSWLVRRLGCIHGCGLRFGIGFYGPAVFLETLRTTKGWPIAAISMATTAHFLVGALVVSHLPELHRAIGIANATILGAFLSAIGMLGWSSVTSPWQLLFVVIVSGSGWGVTSAAAINAMIAPRFDRDRAKTLSCPFNGANLGGVIFTPLLVWLVACMGFHSAAIAVGGAMLLVVGTLSHLYLRHGAADFGIAADGADENGSICNDLGRVRTCIFELGTNAAAQL